MTIQWFPGHMAKARRVMSENLKSVDMVIELRDSRVPNASSNPLLDELCQNKPRMIILTKKDKANEQETEKWLVELNKSFPTLALDLNKDRLQTPITKTCLSLMREKHERQKKRGINPRAIRAMVVGIPNVGKSTLINRLSKRKVADTADRPGVTRSLKMVAVNKDLELVDTPGVLWPKFEDPVIGYYLALSGAISDRVLPSEDVAVFALRIMLDRYSDQLKERYDIELTADPYAILDRIAVKRGYLLNNDIDRKRTVDAFINEIRSDAFGRITWELAHE